MGPVKSRVHCYLCHGGMLVSPPGIAPGTSSFARKRAICYTSETMGGPVIGPPKLKKRTDTAAPFRGSRRISRRTFRCFRHTSLKAYQGRKNEGEVCRARRLDANRLWFYLQTDWVKRSNLDSFLSQPAPVAAGAGFFSTCCLTSSFLHLQNSQFLQVQKNPARPVAAGCFRLGLYDPVYPAKPPRPSDPSGTCTLFVQAPSQVGLASKCIETHPGRPLVFMPVLKKIMPAFCFLWAEKVTRMKRKRQNVFFKILQIFQAVC